MIILAPCIRQDTPLWFWEIWTAGPVVLTDTAVLEVWEPRRSKETLKPSLWRN